MGFDLGIFLDALGSRALREGVVITISLTVVSFVAGVVIGLGVALLRNSRFAVLRALGWGYIWIFRALPTLLLLFFVWNALPAEIIRGGLLSIDDGQRLAARALGMAPLAVFRKIVAPQLVRVVTPTMANDFITLLKITSLASAVSLRELMTNTQTQVASSFRFAEWYGAAAVYYLVLVSLFMVVQAWFERRYVWTSSARAGRTGILRGMGAR